MIIAFAPGGGTDIVGRIIGRSCPRRGLIRSSSTIARAPAPRSAPRWSAKAVPDGYTIQTVSMSHALNTALYRKLPYDPIRDFEHVILAARAPNVLVAHPSLPRRP
jgi:tripartite-type tricarboxylate transporter receptor subunit TctC